MIFTHSPSSLSICRRGQVGAAARGPLCSFPHLSLQLAAPIPGHPKGTCRYERNDASIMVIKYVGLIRAVKWSQRLLSESRYRQKPAIHVTLTSGNQFQLSSLAGSMNAMTLVGGRYYVSHHCCDCDALDALRPINATLYRLKRIKLPAIETSNCSSLPTAISARRAFCQFPSPIISS